MDNQNEFSDSVDSLINDNKSDSNISQYNGTTVFPHDEFEKKKEIEQKKPTEVLKINIQEQIIQEQKEQEQKEQEQKQLELIIHKQNQQLKQQDIILQKYKNIYEQNKTVVNRIKNNINKKEIINTIILFILLSTPFFKDLLKKYLPFLFSNDNINIFGLIVSSIIFVTLSIILKCTIN